MSQYNDLKPDEFAEAALHAIAAALQEQSQCVATHLAETGLFGVCATEDVGGLNLPLDFAVPVVFSAGLKQLRFPLIDQLLLAKHLLDASFRSQLVDGSAKVAIAWPTTNGLSTFTCIHQIDELDWLLVLNQTSAELYDKSAFSYVSDCNLDPDYPQYDLNLQTTTTTSLATLDNATTHALLRDAYVLYGSYLNGLSEHAIQSTSEYVSTRVQFGRPLSAKQAVRHRLAHMQLLLEMSKAAINRTLKTNEYGETRDVRPAFYNALQHCIFSIEQAIHLHGGMGFTWEVPIHYSLREAQKIHIALSASQLITQLGTNFITAA